MNGPRLITRVIGSSVTGYGVVGPVLAEYTRIELELDLVIVNYHALLNMQPPNWVSGGVQVL